jgi:lactoylglutathione lyase
LFRDAFPIFCAADAAALVRFYVEGCGFTQTYRFPLEGPLEFAFLKLDGNGLGIAATSAEARERYRHLTADGSPPQVALCLYSDDLDAAVPRLIAAGARLLVPPADQPWGERLASFADPEGYVVHVVQPIGGR